jgi:hypothetical protein
MALPTLEKTWQYNLNGVYTKGSAQPGYMMLGLKNQLKAITTNPWQVVASSDASSVRNIGYVGDADLWTAYGSLTWSTGAHSWIVLKQTELDAGGNAMLCIDLNNNSTPYCTMILAPNGFNADGTTSARPTAVGVSMTLLSGGLWGTYYDPTYGTYDQRIDVFQSTDGHCTRVFFMRNGAVGLWLFDRAKNPRTDWTSPIVGIVAANNQNNSDWLTTENVCTTSYNYVKGFINSGSSSGYLTYPVYGTGSGKVSALSGGFPAEPSGEWPLVEPGLFFTSANRRGFYGTLYDLWWTDVYRKTGDMFPDDGTKQLACFGQIVHPWDGASPLFTS